jgi:hypothetical protein
MRKQEVIDEVDKTLKFLQDFIDCYAGVVQYVKDKKGKKVEWEFVLNVGNLYADSLDFVRQQMIPRLQEVLKSHAQTETGENKPTKTSKKKRKVVDSRD